MYRRFSIYARFPRCKCRSLEQTQTSQFLEIRLCYSTEIMLHSFHEALGYRLAFRRIAGRSSATGRLAKQAREDDRNWDTRLDRVFAFNAIPDMD